MSLIHQMLLWSMCGLFAIGATRAGVPEKVSHQPNNVLVDFYAYRHVSVVHFHVPENTVSVGFKFIVKEEKISGIGNCNPRNVAIHLKAGSLPFVTPDGSTTAARFLEDRRAIYSLDTPSNGDEHIVSIDAPIPGDWYAIAFRDWSDPNKSKIKQQGLSVNCDTVLDAELQIEKADQILQLGDGSTAVGIRLANKSDTAMAQFHLPSDAVTANLTIKSTCSNNCSMAVHVIADDHLLGSVFNSSETSVGFRPHVGRIHYVMIRLMGGSEANVSLRVDSEVAPRTALARPKLIRKTLPDFFLFDYDFLAENGSKALPIELQVGVLSVLRFRVGAVYDVGGTLSVGLKIADSEEDRKMVLLGCVALGTFSNISSAGHCVHSSNKITAVDIFVANRSTPAFVHVPFPEPGLWHLTVRALCLTEGAETCECIERCATNVTACDQESINTCHCAHECNAKIETSIASSPCIEGACSSHGRCVHYMSGGFVFAACHCTGGYRGFDCADDTYVLSKTNVLARLLLLTLSNLAFIGAIGVAIKREYYTEALVYTAVMVFSMAYHACEAGEEGIFFKDSFCLMKLNVLQFCDFFNALLSIWVTLVAMASFGPRTTSFCQMLGVIFLALGAELDRTALWVFLMPTVSGCILVILAWVHKCRAKGTFLYPARIYRIGYLPIGLIVVFSGLICYAFLQTRLNYYIMHSLWHVCVAVGVILLLPKKEYME